MCVGVLIFCYFPKISDIINISIFIDNISGIALPDIDVEISRTFCNNNLHLIQYVIFFLILLYTVWMKMRFEDLEDGVIHLIVAGADPIPRPSLPIIVDIDHINAKTVSKRSCTEFS